MSRLTQKNEQYEISYGIDHVCGLFIQVFERARRDDDDEGLRLNLDEIFDGLTYEKMANIAEEYGFYIALPGGTIIHD